MLTVPRVGLIRVFPVDELGIFRELLRAAGYLGRVNRTARPAHQVC